MTTLELRTSLMKEIVSILDNENLMRQALNALRRIKESADEEIYVAPTKEEILDDIKEGLRAIKSRQDGAAKTDDFTDLKDFLDEL